MEPLEEMSLSLFMKKIRIYFYLLSTMSVVEPEGLAVSMESLATVAQVGLEAKDMCGMFH